MYRYTPLHSLYKDFIRAEKKGYNSALNTSYVWIIANELFSDYIMRTAFILYWKNVNFYSPKQLQFVPVNGILFPVKYFNEDKLGD